MEWRDFSRASMKSMAVFRRAGRRLGNSRSSFSFSKI